MQTHMSRTERGSLLFGSADICRMKHRGRVSLAHVLSLKSQTALTAALIL